jgi:hypothetical protein
MAGFGGPECEAETDECLSAPCGPNGECTDLMLAFVCVCEHGWNGDHCEHSINPCSRQEVSGCDPINAVCTHIGPGMHTCDCLSGFETRDNGHTCTDIDECAVTWRVVNGVAVQAAPCQNGATCINGLDEFRCTCAAGYEGVVCEQDLNECVSRPCLNGAQCFDGVDEYRCTCRSGYDGSICEVSTEVCSSRPCLNGAACEIQHELATVVYTYRCTCVVGWAGEHCDVELDECVSDPCENGARCEDGLDAYVCDCRNGWVGDNCGDPVNNCLLGEDDCDLDHGECISTGPGTHICQCDRGYESRGQRRLQAGRQTCTQIDECRSAPCLNTGRCTDALLSYTCTCPEGITGQNCATDIDECGSIPCQNGGHCADHVGTYSCRCVQGFQGDNCDVDVDECAGRDNHCEHGATCVDERNSFRCICRAGFMGRACETEVNECLSRPCLHGGFCTDGLDEYACVCYDAYSGENCGDPVGVYNCTTAGCTLVGGEKPPDAPTDGSIQCEQTVTGTTSRLPNVVGNEAGDYVLSFSIPVGTFSLQFDTCASSFDTMLRIMSTDLGTEIVGCDDCGPCGSQSLLDTIMTCTTPADGDDECRYLLVVEGYRAEEGDFEVTMHCNEPHGTDGTIACGETVTGSTVGGANGLGTGSSDHYYSFNLPVDCAVQFDSCLSTFNTFLRIYSLDMINELHSCDDCGDCGTRTVLDAELRAGDYILIIEGYSSDEGEYSVTMNCPDSGDYIDGEIACGDTVQGSTVAAGWSLVGSDASEHMYTFTVERGMNLVQFDSCDSQFDTFLRIMTPTLDTQIEGCDDCGQCGSQTVLDAQLRCDEDICEYVLVVEGFAELEGTYSVMMRCDDPSQMEGSIGCGQTVIGDTAAPDGSLNGADHFYTFALDATRIIQFDSCDSSYDTFLRIFSPDLSEELHACDDCGDCGTRSVLDASLPAGNYILVVGGWESNAGEYAVTMRCPQSRAGFVDGTVRCDQTVVGSTVSVGSHIGEGAGDHIYRFKTNEGATAVHFNSCASDYDTYLRVMTPGTQ